MGRGFVCFKGGRVAYKGFVKRVFFFKNVVGLVSCWGDVRGALCALGDGLDCCAVGGEPHGFCLLKRGVFCCMVNFP